MTEALLPLPPQPRQQHGVPAIGYSLVLVSVTLFVVNAGVSRLVLTNGIGAVDLAAIRASGTALGLGLWLVLTGRLSTLRLRRDEVAPMLLYGIVGVALLQVAYFVAVERLTLGLALLLEYQAPLLVALWVRFVGREPVRNLLWPALGLTLMGLTLVASPWQGATLDLIGVAAGLTAAFSFATYYLVGERLVARRDALSTTFWGFAVAGVLWSVATPWWQQLSQAAGTTATLPAAIGGADVAVLVLVGWVVLAGTLAPFAATTAALRHLPAIAVTLASTLEPVGAALIGWWWFQETLDTSQVIGAVVVLLGIGLAQLARTGRWRAPRGPTIGP